MMMVGRDTAGMGRLVLCIGRGLLKDLALLDQRHRSEQLDNRYQRADVSPASDAANTIDLKTRICRQ